MWENISYWIWRGASWLHDSLILLGILYVSLLARDHFYPDGTDYTYLYDSPKSVKAHK